MILTKAQVKQLTDIFKQNKIVDEVKLREEGTTGIGQNMYAQYVDIDGTTCDIDITDYESW